MRERIYRTINTFRVTWQYCIALPVDIYNVWDCVGIPCGRNGEKESGLCAVRAGWVRCNADEARDCGVDSMGSCER